MDRAEAIEIIRKNMPSDKSLPVYEAIQTLIPELAESDDKRIGNVIYCIVRDNKEVKRILEGNGVSVDNALAYLEKQKELDKMIVVSPEVWDKVISDAYENGKKDDEKQKELFESGRGLYYYDGEKITYCGYPATEENPYDFAISQQEKQKEPHYTKRNALFDKCVENCDPKTVEEVNKRVDDIMNMPELSAFEQALTNFIGYWEDDEERWPSKFVKKHGKHILDMAREELQKEQKHPNGCFTCDEYKKGYEAGRFHGFTAGYNKAMKEQKPAEINEYEIIKKHITDDSLSSEVNKRLKECGWYVTDEKPAERNESDTLMCNAALELLRSHPNLMASNGINKSSIIRWLQSFRPQRQGFIDDICSKAGISIPYLDGNQWCILKGDNIQSGVVGFGDTKEDALANFIKDVPIQQKWGKEDECIRKAILRFLNPDKGGTKYSSNAQLVEWSAWLKSLRPQPYSEWRHYIWATNLQFDFTALIKYDNTDNYEIVQAGNRPKQEKNGVYILIKDIKPQPSWKPSEEQMEAFSSYIKDFQEKAEAAVGGWNNFDVMIRLYEQLKKL